MKTFNHSCRAQTGPVTLISLFLLLAVSLSTPASEPAGRVIASVGRVLATDADGNDRTLTRNDVIYPGETVTTGRRGRVQMRFADDGLVDLKPGSEFEIERYREPAGDDGGSVIFNFFKGALRTITGAIGIGDDDEYVMNTPVATIGVRGTDYSLQFCDAECAEQLPPGLYGRVTKDDVIVTNQYGSGQFAQGQYFLIPVDAEPRLLLTPPAGILDGADDGNTVDRAAAVAERVARLPDGIRAEALEVIRSYLQATGSLDFELNETEFEAADVTVDDSDSTPTPDLGTDCCLAFGAASSISDPDLQQQFVVPNIASLIGPIDIGASFSTSTAATGNSRVDRILFAIPATGDSIAFDFSSTPLQQSSSARGVEWGLLKGPWTQTTDVDNTVSTLEFGAGGLAYALTSDLTTPTEFGVLNGQTLYVPFDGPGAIDSFGDLWGVDSLTINVDFNDASATLDAFGLSGITNIGDSVLFTGQSAALTLDTTAIALATNGNLPVELSIGGGAPLTGELTLQGFFVRAAGDTLPVGFSVLHIDSATGLPTIQIQGVEILIAE